MKLKQELQQRTLQRLSPQQIQVIRLLELNAVELEERIKQEVIDNPALDETDDEKTAKETAAEEGGDNSEDGGDGESSDDGDISLGDYLSEDDIPDYKIEQYERAQEESQPRELPFVGGSSIHEHLLQQLGMQELDEQDEKIAEYIIGNIDDDGYLRRPLSAISDDLIFQVGIDADNGKLQELFSMIRSFDPAGVGATDLQDCLKLQIEREKESSTKRNAEKIITEHFDAFIKKHYDKIQKQLGISSQELKDAIRAITLLNPKPGNIWNSSYSDSGNHVIPDFIVESDDNEQSFTLNNSNIPELKVSPEYVRMYEDYQGNRENRTKERRDALMFVKQKLDSAQWFINAIKQRQETLINTFRAIMAIQKDYFATGEEHDLRPMILKDVASLTGYDISPISRAINGKYAQTPFGIIPLKYLFSESMQNSSGEEISSREIKKILAELVAAEDKSKPLSDDELCARLHENGYRIARRTVAKYREQAGIPVARLRKEL